MADAATRFEFGALTSEQLAAVFDAIPADVTFVDADNIVRYYSAYRIFSRTPAALDRDVLACHPEAMRPRIAQLLSEFATGWRDKAVFLAEKDGRAVHVRYLALRDAGEGYVGCLEIAQWADEIAGQARS